MIMTHEFKILLRTLFTHHVYRLVRLRKLILCIIHALSLAKIKSFRVNVLFNLDFVINVLSVKTIKLKYSKIKNRTLF